MVAVVAAVVGSVAVATAVVDPLAALLSINTLPTKLRSLRECHLS